MGDSLRHESQPPPDAIPHSYPPNNRSRSPSRSSFSSCSGARTRKSTGNENDFPAPAPPLHLMPHASFPTAIGLCGLAWNDSGLTGFSLPEADASLLERRLAARDPVKRAAIAPAPPWVQEIVARV